MNSNDKALKTPLEDLRKQALEHYNELATKACHWNSFVQKAIEAYNPESSSSLPEGEAKSRPAEQIITDFVFEVGKFRDYRNEPYSKILLEVRLWLSENKYWQTYYKPNSEQNVQECDATKAK